MHNVLHLVLDVARTTFSALYSPVIFFQFEMGRHWNLFSSERIQISGAGPSQRFALFARPVICFSDVFCLEKKKIFEIFGVFACPLYCYVHGHGLSYSLKCLPS